MPKIASAFIASTNVDDVYAYTIAQFPHDVLGSGMQLVRTIDQDVDAPFTVIDWTVATPINPLVTNVTWSAGDPHLLTVQEPGLYFVTGAIRLSPAAPHPDAKAPLYIATLLLNEALPTSELRTVSAQSTVNDVADFVECSFSFILQLAVNDTLSIRIDDVSGLNTGVIHGSGGVPGAGPSVMSVHRIVEAV